MKQFVFNSGGTGQAGSSRVKVPEDVLPLGCICFAFWSTQVSTFLAILVSARVYFKQFSVLQRPKFGSFV